MHNNHARDFRRGRDGFTLIEVLGTLSVLLAIALAGTSMLATVTKIGLANKQANQARADIARLAAMFRTDVHAAEMAETSADGQALDLSVDGEMIRYQIDEPSRRIVRKRIEANKQGPLEWFRISDHCQPAFAVGDRQITLRLTTQDARHPWIIQGVRNESSAQNPQGQPRQSVAARPF